MGPGVTNFWEREVTQRWKDQDPGTLDTVHALLSQIMIRHSKTQKDRGSEQAILALPPRHMQVKLRVR